MKVLTELLVAIAILNFASSDKEFIMQRNYIADDIKRVLSLQFKDRLGDNEEKLVQVYENTYIWKYHFQVPGELHVVHVDHYIEKDDNGLKNKFRLVFDHPTIPQYALKFEVTPRKIEEIFNYLFAEYDFIEKGLVFSKFNKRNKQNYKHIVSEKLDGLNEKLTMFSPLLASALKIQTSLVQVRDSPEYSLARKTHSNELATLIQWFILKELVITYKTLNSDDQEAFDIKKELRKKENEVNKSRIHLTLLGSLFKDEAPEVQMNILIAFDELPKLNEDDFSAEIEMTKGRRKGKRIR
jgi:hypothetical protein